MTLTCKTIRISKKKIHEQRMLNSCRIIPNPEALPPANEFPRESLSRKKKRQRCQVKVVEEFYSHTIFRCFFLQAEKKNSLTQSINVLKIFFVSFYSDQGDLKFKNFQRRFLINRKCLVSCSFIYTAKMLTRRRRDVYNFKPCPSVMSCGMKNSTIHIQLSFQRN